MADDCNIQIATARVRCIGLANRSRLRHNNHPSDPAAAMIANTNTHRGHEPNSTKVPFENTLGGYLKRNSNISVGCPVR
jgi:hypothetical protein